MLIQFDKALCPRHHRPLDYICMTNDCPCSMHLCTTCTTNHCKRYNRGDFMKVENFSKKIQMETDIIKKQYDFIQKYTGKDSPVNLLSSKNDEKIKMVEFVLRVVNEDKKAVFKAIDEFIFNHLEVKKKLAKIKASYNLKYLQAIQNSLLPTVVNISSSLGLEKFRKKIIACQNGSKRYLEFLSATDKYGNNNNSFLTGVGFKYVLLRDSIRGLIPKGKAEIRAITNQVKQQEKKGSIQKNRCEQIFVPIPNSAKKIRLVTPQKRPRTASSGDKQN